MTDDILRPDELAYLKANQSRCAGCGHLDALHNYDLESGTDCNVDGCTCQEGETLEQREKKLAEARARETAAGDTKYERAVLIRVPGLEGLCLLVPVDCDTVRIPVIGGGALDLHRTNRTQDDMPVFE